MKIIKTLSKSMVLATLLAAGAGSQAAVTILGAPFLNPANGHSYYLISPATWPDAESYAQTLGGHLVTVNDAAENAWILQNILLTDLSLNPWTGLHSATLAGPWTWSSGEPVSYLNWDTREPNGIGAPPYGVNLFPAQYQGAIPGSWNDAPYTDVIPGIVEVVPEPPSVALVVVAGLGLGCRRFKRVCNSMDGTPRQLQG